MTVTLKDLWKILVKNKRVILYSGLFCALLLAGYKASFPVSYTAEAYFKDREKGETGLENSLTKLLLGSSKQGPVAEAARLMQSRKVLEPMIVNLGLQASLDQRESSFFSKFFTHLYVQMKQWQKAPIVILQPRPLPLQMREVHYAGENINHYHLVFVDDHSYAVSAEGKEVAVGKIDEPLFVDGASWILTSSVSMPLQGKSFTLTLTPLQLVAKSLVERIDIEVDHEDESVLVLKFTDDDRYQAVEIVNRLMDHYRDYLISDNEKMMALQIAYLRKRQKEVFGEQYKLLEAHAKDLSEEMSEVGFADADTEIEYFVKRHLETSERLNALTLRETHLQTALHHRDQKEYPYLLDDENVLISGNLLELLALRQQRDLLKKRLQERSTATPLSMNEEMLGMDLQMADRLFLSYHEECTELECEMRQHRFLAEQIHQPTFEISSLSTTLKDSVSKGIIDKSSEIALLLHDDAFRGEKEKERLRNELGVQKRFLHEHLLQTASLYELRHNILQEKIISLQVVILGLVEQKILLLEKEIQDNLQGKVVAIDLEKDFLHKHLKKIDGEMTHLPKKWISDQVLNQSLELNKAIIEEITRLVEGKNISHHLQIVRSDALEEADLPLKPDPSRLPFYLAIGFFAGCTLAGTGTIFASTMKGVLVSEENLTLSGFYVAGTIDRDQHLPALRRAIAFIDGQSEDVRDLLVIEDAELHTAPLLAQLLTKRGKSVVVLNFCEQGHQHGLLQYLEGGPDFSIQHRQGYDEVVGGGSSPYLVDYLSSSRFQSMSQTLMEKYDVVITMTQLPAFSAEALTLIPRFDCSVVNIGQEPLWHLKPYLPLKKLCAFIL